MSSSPRSTQAAVRAAARPAMDSRLVSALALAAAMAAMAGMASAQAAPEPKPEAPATTEAQPAEATSPATTPATTAAEPAEGAAASGTPAEPAASDFRQAGATLLNAEGAEVGDVIITETASGVLHLILDLRDGVLPAAQHGFHIHETGACEAPSFESAGGHLAGDKEHGIQSPNGIHLGDLPNITTYDAGAVHVEYFLADVPMDQILDDDGSAVVIHDGVDDYTTQPSGNAGDRLACGVLEESS